MKNTVLFDGLGGTGISPVIAPANQLHFAVFNPLSPGKNLCRALRR
jgi:hypothetical protein